ncbi:MAG TPA: hypothetical protein PK031_03725 [Pseudomonadales bacterium]|nr:hypothetical protein [Pseudomonadales bacterium]
MRKQILTITSLLTCSLLYAKGPTHVVHTQTNALGVNYYVESSELQTKLYATNHEDFEIVCDASMVTNKQEKTRSHEITIAAHKTDVFHFRHRASIKEITLFLVCEAPAQSDHQTKQERPVSDTKAGSTTPTIKVQEENLDAY